MDVEILSKPSSADKKQVWKCRWTIEKFQKVLRKYEKAEKKFAKLQKHKPNAHRECRKRYYNSDKFRLTGNLFHFRLYPAGYYKDRDVRLMLCCDKIRHPLTFKWKAKPIYDELNNGEFYIVFALIKM